MRTRILLALASLYLAGCATLVPVPEQQNATPDAANAAWDRVLDRHVDEQGRVDYRGLSRGTVSPDHGQGRRDLDLYVGWLATHGPQASPALFPTPQHVLAHHLNAYNALAMYNVVQAGVPQSLSAYGLVKFFWVRELRIDGRQQSLYSYEKRIRALGDARIHFALNCMAAGCPRLPRRPFYPATLETDLDRETRFFFAEPRNLALEHARRVVRVTEIMRFFPEDFLATAPSLIAYVNRYAAEKVPEGYALEFIPYDWNVAAQPVR